MPTTLRHSSSWTTLALLGALLLLTRTGDAQPTSWAWGNAFSTNGNEAVNDVALDRSNGWIYAVGTYSQAGPFGLPASSGGRDAFLAKLDMSGAVLWSQRIGGTQDEEGLGVAVGPNGHVYVTGSTRSTIAVTILAISTTLSNSGGNDAFIASYSSAGVLQWMQTMGGSSNDVGRSVAVNNAGVFVHGEVRGSSSFETLSVASDNASGAQVFLARYQLNGGSPTWVMTGGGDGDELAEGLAIDDQGVALSGTLRGAQFTWRNSAGTVQSTVACTNNGSNGYVARVLNNGTIQWTRLLDNPNSHANSHAAIALHAGSVFLAGHTHAGTLFPAYGPVAQGAAHDLLYIVRLNGSNGDAQWVRTATGSEEHGSQGLSMAAGPQGQLYTTAVFNGPLTFDNGVIHPGGQDSELMVARFDQHGALLWSRVESASGNEYAKAIATGNNGELIVAGSFDSGLELPPFSHTTGSSNSAFIARTNDPDWNSTTAVAAHWKVLPDQCTTNAPFDLNTRLKGHADAWRSQSGISNVELALGAPDGQGCLFANPGNTGVLDLGDTVLTNMLVKIRLRSTNSGDPSKVRIQYSLDGIAWTDHGSEPQVNSSSFIDLPIYAPAPFRYLRITLPNSPPNGPLELDAITFLNETVIGGTWSGPGVSSAGIFDPAMASGEVSIAYTVVLGTQTWVVSRTFWVSPPPSGTIAGPTTICPGNNGQQLTLTGLSQHASIIGWSTSQDGVNWTSVGNDLPTLSLNGFTGSPQFVARLNARGCGSTASNTITVSVIDTIPPVITGCPNGPIIVNSPSSGCSATVTWNIPTVSDNCSGVVISQTQGLPPGSVFPVGFSTITYAAADVAGNLTSCSFLIEVRDVTNPVITCPEDIAVDATAGLCGAIVTFPLAIASDNCGVATINQMSGPSSGSFFPVGSTQVTFRVTTNTGQNRNCNFWVTVFDSQAPTITGCTNASAVSTTADCSVPVNHTLPTANDNCSTCPTVSSLVGFLPIGTYEGRSYYLRQTNATWGAANAAAVAAGGHLAVVRHDAMNTWLRAAVTNAGTPGSFWIGLNDAGTEGSWRWTNSSPVAYTNWDIGEPNSSGGNEDYLELKSNGLWNDERSITTRPFVLEVEAGCITPMLTAGGASGSPFPIGSNAVQYTTTDAAGNSATCSFTVNVSDGAAPTVFCPLYDMYPVYLGPNCTVAFPDLRDSLMVTDCSPWTNTMMPPAATEFVRDTIFMMSMDIQDIHGNLATNNHTIHVTDTVGPTFNCPASLLLFSPGCSALLPDLTTLITDVTDCSGPISITQELAAGTVITASQSVVIEARDVLGNTRRCSVQVILDLQDSDNDGTPDCNDTCPLDPNKTEPGLCGCSIPEGTCQDCTGLPFGSAVLDNCGTCVGGNTGLTACIADCNGEFGGTAAFDNCGTCVGGNTGLSACVADCNGEFGGTAVLDNCNTCVGGNTGLTACVADCNGDFGGTAVLDNCGTCVGGNTGLTACVADCNGDFGGTAVLDNCNTCVGGNTGLTACVADCNGDFGGTAVLDNCNTCVGGNTGLSACVADCNGEFGGTAVLDNCGTCVGGSTGLTACVADCNGEFGGTAVLDNCNTCVGGNTGLSACLADCNGDFGGTAVLDNCGTCVGGNTGLTACVADCNGDFGGTAVLDNCNTCVGGNTGLSACLADCNGDFGGTAVLDICNTCVGGNTGLTACVADCNGDFGGTAVLDNCGTCVGGSTGLTACVADCNGDFGGTAVLDNCGTCVGGNTGQTACLADCNGDFGGTAVLDNCNTCVGGNTGLTACVADCNGVFGGTAVLDNCSTCVGGNTGLIACVADCNGDFGGAAVLDNCNTCVGGNTGLTACVADCNGDFGGTAVLDNCGTCIGVNTGLSACLADCNGDFGGTAFMDNCSTCVGGNTGLTACIQDCIGTWGGSALPGTPCNDGQANTVNDVWGNNCICAGTPSGCTSDAGPDRIVCGLAATMSAAGTGTWAAPVGFQFSDASSPNAVVNAPAPGTFTLFWTTGNGNCSATDMVQLTFLSEADPSFSYSQSNYCANSMPPMPWAATQDGAFSATPAGLSLNAITGEIDPSQSVPGSYVVTHSFAGVCPTSASQNVTIDVPVDASWVAPADLCSNAGPIDLDQLVTGTNGGIWSGPGVNGSTFHPSAAPAMGMITYSVGNGGCSDSLDQPVHVRTAPVANAGPDAQVCGLDHFMQAVGGGSGMWSIPTGIFISPDATSPDAHITAATPGTYTLTWTVDDGVCSSSDQASITFFEVGPPIQVDAGSDQRLALQNSTSLYGSATNGAVVEWSVLAGSGYFTHPTSVTTDVEGLAVGLNTFVLSAWMGNCASGHDTVIVIVDDFFIPEGFSPNGDGVNDRFEITGMEAFPGSEFQVFDRAGMLVYEHASYDNSWDGRSKNGRDLPDGTYFYILNLGTERTYNGSITLKH